MFLWLAVVIDGFLFLSIKLIFALASHLSTENDSSNHSGKALLYFILLAGYGLIAVGLSWIVQSQILLMIA